MCQQNKVNHDPTCPLLTPIPSSFPLPFKQLSVDMITDLPPLNRHNSLVVVVDHGLMKGVILTPCSKTINVAGVAKLFLHHVFIQFRLHEFLISDREAHSSHLPLPGNWPDSFTTMSNSPLHITPQTDGQTERTHQEVEMYLRISAPTTLEMDGLPSHHQVSSQFSPSQLHQRLPFFPTP